MHLVHDHVLQLLVVYRAEEDVGRKRLAGDARCELILARVAVAVLDQYLAQILCLVPREGLRGRWVSMSCSSASSSSSS